MPHTNTLAAAAAAILLISSSAYANTPAKVPAKAPAKAVKVAKAMPAAAAVAAAPVVLTQGQLDAAARVYTGAASCEFDQTVNLAPIDGKPGHFKLSHKKASYTVVPEETTTGAVRLEDRKAGIVWLQIPAKSMLMNAKLGQRMVDSCLHAEQRNAAAPAEGATIGIVAAKP